MLSQEGANACIEAAAAELKQLSYEELEKLAACQDGNDVTLDRELKVSGETVYVNTAIGKLGRIHKRVCVEMVLSAKGGTLWPDTPCVYFERFESGRLYVARAKGWETALFKALPYAFLGVVAIALVALVWHLFLRGG